MQVKDLKALIKLITETDITEFEMENSEEKIVIKRGPEKEYIPISSPTAVSVPPSVTMPTSTTEPAPSPQPAPSPAEDHFETINSPIVGTFYRKPSPEADSFVEVGSTVEPGQAVCLVEAMKLFNEIEAEFKCKIIEILKDDAAPVEFGEPLFKVERL